MAKRALLVIDYGILLKCEISTFYECMNKLCDHSNHLPKNFGHVIWRKTTIWSNTSHCDQLAAETNKRPIRIYPSSPKMLCANFLPLVFLSNESENQQPLIRNHINNNH
ncbi:hypothetical protein PHYBLDRAFT_151038 [Phycomyces blakesleeanus NRRL 1555(-)]|uniref:Uncharacterized protein n=1 Tax=Phycomyces blakesleeanus (strain ATCC 8743b / DSM 1359 / FGSC 10004 / NBRC 33097 / NRRL 1555) TaxID=763407 RepID=A0A167KF49_PHYB8|nr:hypothetical protein PHYBLDRAFT_151038 [Phycomyces blakesleeanus NRRL 1555(-)]OAD67955.1 hypothetical protein PHYBLDRAFT_151038 [Phycomyces blakesleeanus NRRL 1555(-)]|eukprot:XP_018285995.1 hypothetical protein PHYBLDRAFT_151038 [Phycomyces blakesleeanus NRRL 1555(-)]